MNDTIPVADTDLDSAIIRQVEYYFGDVNLPKDKFLQDEMRKNDGWVEIEKLLTFNRLKAISSDALTISAAVKKSPNNILEVSDDNSKVRRSVSNPLPENRLEFWKQTKARTIYVKGFPSETKLDELMDFFAKYGKVDNIFMRRTRDNQKTFKGSVFVTFQAKDICSEILQMEGIKYGDVELVKMQQDAYFGKKEEERRERKAQTQANKKAANALVRGKNKPDKTDGDAPYAKGTVLHLTHIVEDGSKLSRELIRTAFQEKGDVKWIDFQMGDKEAFVRFSDRENSAEEALAKLEVGEGGQVHLGASGVLSQVSVLNGDQEQGYWDRTAKAKQSSLQRRNENKFKGGRKKQFKGKPHIGRTDNVENVAISGKKEAVKRTADDGNGDPAVKVPKTE